jgi:hypothetical protein
VWQPPECKVSVSGVPLIENHHLFRGNLKVAHSKPPTGYTRHWVSYCCPTAAKAPDMDIGGFCFCSICRKNKELTSGLEPLT